MRVADVKGLKCPAPLIATKRALREANTGESFMVITDSRTSFDNITRFLKDNKTEFTSEETDGIWNITVTKKITEIIAGNTDFYCTTDIPHFNKGDFVVVFTSDMMGEGNEELGHLLMTNFIKAVRDLDELPEKMIFYNTGVLLGTEDSAVAEHLREIEKMGVMLLFCETCVKYLSLEGRIKIGLMSNMFEIAQALASAGKILKP